MADPSAGDVRGQSVTPFQDESGRQAVAPCLWQTRQHIVDQCLRRDDIVRGEMCGIDVERGRCRHRAQPRPQQERGNAPAPGPTGVHQRARMAWASCMSLARRAASSVSRR